MITSKVLGPEATRELLIERVDYLESLPDFREPTPEMWETYGAALPFFKNYSHKTNRGKREIAADLNINVSDLEAMFIGKSILDIGCGEGRFSQEIARLKKTSVTALDHDPEILAKVKEVKNLRAVLGSGFNIQEAIGNEQFDVVLSVFSSLHWAASMRQKEEAVESALRACKVGGTAIFIPLTANIKNTEANRSALDNNRLRGFNPKEVDEKALAFNWVMLRVYDWQEANTINLFLDAEEQRRVDCTFTSSRENAMAIPVRSSLTGSDDPAQDRYSVIADVLSN